MTLEAEGCIISTTGSNPLHPKSMSKLAQSGLVVFLDMSKDSILKRLNMMKVNRIVGQKSGASMSDILEYRQDFYERWYDLRIICEDGETQESVAQKVCVFFNVLLQICPSCFSLQKFYFRFYKPHGTVNKEQLKL